MAQQEEQAYYYADKQKVYLRPCHDFVAVDAGRLPQAAKKLQQTVRSQGHQLRRDVYLVPREQLTAGDFTQIHDAAAEQPVYLHDDTMLVVLPEIRVEDFSQQRQLLLSGWADEHAAKLIEDRRGRTVIEPISGNGRDALQLANQLHEQLGFDSAQPRMLRLVRRPTG